MPSVEEAMRRSMGTGALESIVRTVRRGLGERDVVSDVTQSASDFKTAISSWDNCMATTFCKWPLIAIIIVGGLIIGSILWCIIRRICCGLSCCCSCFSCFKCCGNCMGCCDSPRRKNGYMDDSYRQTNSHDGYNYGYKPQPAMVPVVVVPQGGGGSHGGSSKPQYAEFAEFDTKRNGGGGGEDSLPAMPVWDDSNSKKVMIEEEVEMEPLKKPEPSPPLSAPQNQNLAAVGGGASGRGTPVSRGQSPVGPYGRPLDRVPTAGSSFGPPSAAPVSGFAPPQRANTYADPYNNPTTSSSNTHPYGYNGGNNGQYAGSISTGITDAYPPRSNSAAGYSQTGRQTPVGGPYGQDRGYGHGNEAPYGGAAGGYSGNDYQYGQAPQQQHQQQGYGHEHGYQQEYQQGYGQDQQYGGGANQGYGRDQQYGGGNPGYGNQNYGNQGYNDAYARQPSPAFSAGGRPLMDAHQFSAPAPAPSTSPRPQYVEMPAAPPHDQFSSSGPGSPRLVNNAGFDFNSGFSRPETPRGPGPGPIGSLTQAAPARQLAYGNPGQGNGHGHSAGNGYNSYGGGGDHDELHGV